MLRTGGEGGENGGREGGCRPVAGPILGAKWHARVDLVVGRFDLFGRASICGPIYPFSPLSLSPSLLSTHYSVALYYYYSLLATRYYSLVVVAVAAVLL